MSPKTVLQLIESWGPGGAETVVLELAKRLKTDGYRSIVGLFREGWLGEQLKDQGIEVVVFTNRRSCDPAFFSQLVKTVREKNASIVHAHEFTMNVYGTMAAALAGRPSVATVHGKKYYCDKWHRRAAYRSMQYFASEITTVSEDSKRFLSESTGIRHERISVIHNAIDLEKFDGAAAVHAREIKALEGLGDRSPVIGAVGNVYPVKGHIYLIRAAKRIVADFPDAMFIIIGKATQYQKELEAEVKRLSLESNFRFLGFRGEVSRLLRAMDVFVLPSVHETFSIATVEAMAASRAVVATRCGGPEEIIEDGQTGLLVPPEDELALSHAILKLLRKPAFSERISAAARQASERFGYRKMLHQYQAMYEKHL